MVYHSSAEQGFTPVMRMRIKKEKRELGMANILVFDALTLQVARDPDDIGESRLQERPCSLYA